MNRLFLEKFGSLGAAIAALACPICFPKLALIGAARRLPQPSSILLQISLLGLVVASIWQVVEARHCVRCASAQV